MATLITRIGNKNGFSLLETMVAMTVLSVVVGASATSLISSYSQIDMQNRRVIATNSAKRILSDMRSIREANQNTDTTPTAFQTAVLTKYPDATELTGSTHCALPNSKVKISYANASTNADPLMPTVTVEWTDLQGRPISTPVSTALTGR